MRTLKKKKEREREGGKKPATKTFQHNLRSSSTVLSKLVPPTPTSTSPGDRNQTVRGWGGGGGGGGGGGAGRLMTRLHTDNLIQDVIFQTSLSYS